MSKEIGISEKRIAELLQEGGLISEELTKAIHKMILENNQIVLDELNTIEADVF